MRLKDMFQWDVAWEPHSGENGEWLARVRAVMDGVWRRVEEVFSEGKVKETETEKDAQVIERPKSSRNPSNFSTKGDILSPSHYASNAHF